MLLIDAKDGLESQDVNLFHLAQKNGKGIESVCKEVSYGIDFVESAGASGGMLTIVNRGNVPIRKIELKVITGGNSKRNSFPIVVDVGSSGSGEISYESTATNVIIYPVIAGNVQGKSITKEYTCLENGQVLSIS